MESRSLGHAVHSELTADRPYAHPSANFRLWGPVWTATVRSRGCTRARLGDVASHAACCACRAGTITGRHRMAAPIRAGGRLTPIAVASQGSAMPSAGNRPRQSPLTHLSPTTPIPQAARVQSQTPSQVGCSLGRRSDRFSIPRRGFRIRDGPRGFLVRFSAGRRAWFACRWLPRWCSTLNWRRFRQVFTGAFSKKSFVSLKLVHIIRYVCLRHRQSRCRPLACT